MTSTTPTTQIKRVLIANRGEIACRIMKTCHEMNIETISVYTEIEKNYPHAVNSTIGINLGEGSLADTYLNSGLLIELAKKHQADAIHPGYGFLSENADFVKEVQESDLIFIGPNIDAISLMGDKIESKKLIEKINGPMIPGYHGDNQDATFLKAKADEIGYPVLIKASAGGGGKGMRIVESEKDFLDSLDSAKREALNAFKNDKVLIEKYITKPRHIEVQVFSDSHGNHVHLFERECSIQRRYQKIVEETPSKALDDDTRKRITESAVKIAKEINYLGAGTVEFILDVDNQFYFLEMNTRLQVEHPITELICNVDLVRWQILVASGYQLPLKQSELSASGHALELRLYAEDPDNDFLPTLGTIARVKDELPVGVRLDTGFSDGNLVSMNFDPMLAKLIISASTREECIAKAIQALNQCPFLGIKSNRSYLKRILTHPKFVSGETYTSFIETYGDDLAPKNISDETMAVVIAAKILNKSSSNNKELDTENTSAWNDIKGFRNV